MPSDRERPRKRQRATQACHRCRSKKFRCDAEGPPCGACQTAQVSCSYDDATVVRRRGLKPGYVKILESLWGSVFQSVPGSEDVAVRLLARLPSSAEPGNDHHDQSPLQTWRSSALASAIDILLDGGELERSGNPSVERDEAAESDSTWTLPQSLPPDAENTALANTINSPMQSTSNFAPVSSLGPYPEPSSLSDLPADWQLLVQVYLCTEHSWLPLFEKSSLYCWAYSYQEHASIKTTDLDVSTRGNYASMWATFVLAELHLNGSTSTRMGQLEQVGKSLLGTAESIEPDSTYSLAFLLWTLVYTGRHSLVLARMMLAQAIILSDTRASSVHPSGARQQALVQNGCLVIDTLLLFATGSQQIPADDHPISFDLGDVGEWDPFFNALSQDGPDVQPGASSKTQAPPSRTGSTYVELMKLMTVLRHALQKSVGRDALARELQSWRGSLPNHLRALVAQSSIPERTTVPSQCMLHLWYVVVSYTAASFRPETASSEGFREGSNELDLHIADILDGIIRAHGVKILPSVMSIPIHHFFRRTHSRSPTALSSSAPKQVSSDFAQNWGWSTKNVSAAMMDSGTNPIIAREAQDRAPHVRIRANTLITPMDSQASYTNERHNASPQRMASIHHLPSTPFQTQPRQNPGVSSIHTPGSQMLAVNPTLSAASTTGTNNPSALEHPFSHDLLDYLTMFESDDKYVFHQSFPPLDLPFVISKLLTDSQ